MKDFDLQLELSQELPNTFKMKDYNEFRKRLEAMENILAEFEDDIIIKK